MKNRNMVFDFTQCYPKRKEPGLEWHDCSAIGGSRLYCSRDAGKKIKALIAPAGVSGIHFIDSGDYHYISKIMTDFIKEPFTLVLIDHHTDMQDASLGGDILSCGNWAKKVLQENSYLQKLVLIGQEKKVLDKLQSGARQQETDGKLVEISYEELKNGKAHEKIKELPDEVPVYTTRNKHSRKTYCPDSKLYCLKIMVSPYPKHNSPQRKDGPKESSASMMPNWRRL